MGTFDEFLQKQLQDPEVKREYDALAPEFMVVQAILDARKSTGISRDELAQKSGISVENIGELEEGEGNPSVKTLQKLARAMGMQLRLEFVPEG